MKVFSLGYRCSSAGLLKYIAFKTESYPFDWYVKAGSNISDSNIELNINLLYDLLDGMTSEQITNKLLACLNQGQQNVILSAHSYYCFYWYLLAP